MGVCKKHLRIYVGFTVLQAFEANRPSDFLIEAVAVRVSPFFTFVRPLKQG